jgi:thiosulfate dehydrogenase
MRNATIVALLGLFLVSLGASLLVAAEPAAQQEGDPVHGGQIYDEWWAVLSADEEAEGEHEHEGEGAAPDTDHPLWVTQDTNTRSGADTWRCKECHGWDYKGADGAYGSGSHFTGFPGIFDSQNKSFDDLMAAMTGGANPDHDFSAVMGEQDLVDVVTFMSQSLVDANSLLNDDSMSAGEAAGGETLYAQVCTHCHGPEGNAINFGALDDPEFIGHLAADNPWEFIHKVRFGQPGWPMPSAIGNGWSDQDIANVLAYAESFTTAPALSGGGQLYDEWWVVLGVDEPTGDQPLWATQDTNTRSGADTWRCKECHGWDYRGADGAYGSGSHTTGFAGVLDASSLSSDELLAWFNGQANPDHDFSAAMGETGMDAMVAFIQQEMTDISSFVDGDGMVSGDPRNGRDLFGDTCANCHGVDGKTHNFGSEDEPEYVGTLAVDNPWEFFHKASFGQPGEPMPQGRALGWTMQDIADVLAYAQTLPTE